jgi:hypothetical protein
MIFSFDTAGIIYRECVPEDTTADTAMRRKPTGIRSEKCVVKRCRRRRRANVI